MKTTFFFLPTILLVFLLRPEDISGQVDTAWTRIYNGPQFEDVSNAACSDQAGAVYLTGYSSSNTMTDCLTIKYGSNGTIRWTRRFDGTGHRQDEGKAIAIDDNANIYIAGFTGDTIPGNWTSNALIMKYDSAGNLLWLMKWDGEPSYSEGGNYASHIAVDTAGNVYVAGLYYAINPYQGYNFFVLKYTSSGIFQWARNYNGPGGYADDEPTDLTVDKAGNAIVTGKSRQSTYYFTEDYATISYDPAGNQRWVKRYDGPAGYVDIPLAITTDDSCNVYVTGYSNKYSYNMLTIKYDSSGNEKRIERYKSGWESRGNDIAIDQQRNIYVTGNYGDSYLTVKYSPDWSVLWEKEYYFQGGGGGGSRMLLTGDTGVIVAGTSVGDIATIRYDENGNLKWIHRFNGNGNSTDWVTGIAAGPSPSVYVSGATADSVHGDDYVVMKLIPAVNRYLRNVEVKYTNFRCFDAFSTITVAGSGTFFTVRSGGYATLIAGAWITMLPGTKVEEGGYLRASVTSDGLFCNTLFSAYYLPGTGSTGTEAVLAHTDACFRIFPNPVRDICTISSLESNQLPAGWIEIRNVTGQLVRRLFHPGQSDVVLSLANLPEGVYFVSLKSETICKALKIIRY